MKIDSFRTLCQRIFPLVLTISAFTVSAGAQTPAITTVRIASGLTNPLFVTHAPGDYLREFIVDQDGRIMIYKNGAVLSTPYLDIHSIIAFGGEQGLLGLAFDPGYNINGHLYVDYTNISGNTVVARYTVSANPDVANPATALQIIGIAQPFANHNGGWIAFGPDGYLYIAMGDGGSGNDPNGNGQNTGVLLGKMLRIDPSADGFPADPNRNYSIPPTNPFAIGGGAPEIWAYGLRNPWRDSFDTQTGDFWIADVGQDAHEEIDFQPANAPSGRNYGWRCMEGFSCTGLTGCTCNSAALTLPIYDYPHTSGNCSITGGYVYRGAAIPGLQGSYFFGDYCGVHTWTLRYNGSSVSGFTDRTADLAPGFGQSISSITSFGQDAAGELYICDGAGGQVFKIISNSPAGARLSADNSPYALRGVIVSAAFTDYFYVESDSRYSGIRVNKTAHGLNVGSRADVKGVVLTNSDGERYIQASTATSNGTGTVKELGLNNRTVGGGNWHYDPVSKAGQQGVKNGLGMNNIGLLVKTWGKYTQLTSQTFTVDDGAGVGIACVVPATVTLNATWKYVTVTGASSCQTITGDIRPLIRVRGQGDIVPLP